MTIDVRLEQLLQEVVVVAVGGREVLAVDDAQEAAEPRGGTAPTDGEERVVEAQQAEPAVEAQHAGDARGQRLHVRVGEGREVLLRLVHRDDFVAALRRERGHPVQPPRRATKRSPEPPLLERQVVQAGGAVPLVVASAGPQQPLVVRVGDRRHQHLEVRVDQGSAGRQQVVRADGGKDGGRVAPVDAVEKIAAEKCVGSQEGKTLLSSLRSMLNKPVRVCGVVKNLGEPGGGPFWAPNSKGDICLQIIESSESTAPDPEQNSIFTAATHFNPVKSLYAPRNIKGNKFNLTDFVDPSTCFISKKSKDGKDLKALELPGLWNGAMADWITIFVEVPVETFNPVKTVNDLLRPNHQSSTEKGKTAMAICPFNVFFCPASPDLPKKGIRGLDRMSQSFIL